MIYVSPGVYTREWDFSLYTRALSSTVAAIVGPAEKGVLNKVTDITNAQTLIDTFGNSLADSYAIIAGLQYLKSGKILKFVRVAGTTIASATAELVDAATVPATSLTATATSPGTWLNGWKISINTGTTSDTLKLTISDTTGKALEQFDNLAKATAIDFVNGQSEYITLAEGSGGDPIVADYTLSGGDNGTSDIANGDYIGTSSPKTGLQLFSDPDSIDINLISCPGVSDNAVTTELASIATSRHDCMSMIDSPSGLNVSSVIDWRNSQGTYVGDAAVNTSFATTAWPWPKVYDPYLQTERLLPPSAALLQVMAYNDYMAAPWYAPAGYNRGVILGATGLETDSPDQGQRDLLYGFQNGINPIVSMSKVGIRLMGEKTLQYSSTSLDRINVRRMLNYAEKLISTTAKSLLFEPNDTVTWNRFELIAHRALSPILAGRGISEYKVFCDSGTNTPDLVDQSTMRAKLLIIPKKAAEKIVLDFVLLPTGAKFDEYVTAL